MVMSRHTSPLVGCRERLADTESVALTLHLKSIRHAPLSLPAHQCCSPLWKKNKIKTSSRTPNSIHKSKGEELSPKGQKFLSVQKVYRLAKKNPFVLHFSPPSPQSCLILPQGKSENISSFLAPLVFLSSSQSTLSSPITILFTFLKEKKVLFLGIFVICQI